MSPDGCNNVVVTFALLFTDCPSNVILLKICLKFSVDPFAAFLNVKIFRPCKCILPVKLSVLLDGVSFSMRVPEIAVMFGKSNTCSNEFLIR